MNPRKRRELRRRLREEMNPPAPPAPVVEEKKEPKVVEKKVVEKKPERPQELKILKEIEEGLKNPPDDMKVLEAEVEKKTSKSSKKKDK